MELSSKDMAIKTAHEKGYKFVNGQIISPFSNLPRALDEDKGRQVFTVRVGSKNCKVSVSRFVAYKKFGDKIFDKDKWVVYHKDGNTKNNLEDNILIGSLQEAQMSKKEEVRISAATKASPKKHDHELIIRMHKEGKTYLHIMKETGIKSKGTISFIINKSIEKTSSE